MKKLFFILLGFFTFLCTQAEDGSKLWLRYPPLRTAQVNGPEGKASEVLKLYYDGKQVTLNIDATMPANDGYRIEGSHDDARISAHNQAGLLYGAFALLRGETGSSSPYFSLRLLNHWDNLDGSIERGYAGESIFWNEKLEIDPAKIEAYAMANASIGINGTVLNNVNASPKMLTPVYINKVKEIADILRPWGIRVYISVNFGSPKALGEIETADPLNKKVRRWWKKKADEIYKLIPDFGGFLVKANSEGQPGPFDYDRTHADGANMLADALKPHGGIVMWRSFVYGAKHKGEDRVMQAVSEFKPHDGEFRDNVILQSKNGPLDFQPREPYAPIFDQMTKTTQMAELQITQEYLGHSQQLVFLAPMWEEFFTYVAPSKLKGIAGVANIGLDTNWCGHHFAQANWYAFGRLAWNPKMTSKEIAEEWLKQTFENEELKVKGEESKGNERRFRKENGSQQRRQRRVPYSTVYASLLDMMLRSREACVDYMMPLGLHHIFKFDHHYGPEPDGFKANYPLEWCPVYYHKADEQGVGFDRSTKGSGATQQYPEPYRTLYNSLETCPEEFILWFHHVPWDYKMKSGRTLIDEMDFRYQRGVNEVIDFIATWQQAKPYIDPQRWQEVNDKLTTQLVDAREWQQVCTKYFGSFARQKK
ncbi:MAG: alpha-glucuronidase [Bacteroidaceae bacterium]|nr:alpha-glucuronidase [Bacteroidaceae bacterium]